MNPYRHLTIIGLIVAAAIVFAGEQIRHASWAESHGAVPAEIVAALSGLRGGNVSQAVLRPFVRLITALFLHGSPEHIVYNAVFLWTFGYLVSELLGQWWALAVFFLCGVCGNILQTWLNPESNVPIIGASGAICGFQGVYLGLALRWQLSWPSVWPLAYAVPPLQLGALAVLGFIADMYFLANRGDGIAYGAHVGGFLSGLSIATLLTTFYPTIGEYERARLKK